MNNNITSLVGILIVVVVVFSGIFLLANNKSGSNSEINLTSNYSTNQIAEPTQSSAIMDDAKFQGTPAADPITMQDGLIIQDLVVGTGNEVKSGDTVTVNYLGTFEDGVKFDSSYDRNAPLSTPIGVGSVIKGWDEGIIGMKTGGKRKLTVPPDLGYGPQDYNGIPGNSTLIFEVELVSIK